MHGPGRTEWRRIFSFLFKASDSKRRDTRPKKFGEEILLLFFLLLAPAECLLLHCITLLVLI